MGHVVSFNNFKGGSGRTTTVIDLAAVLEELGYKVLVIDADPQGNASIGFGIEIFNLEQTIRDVLIDDMPLEKAIIHARPNIDIVPSNFKLALAETRLYERYKREERLKMAVEKIRDQYDFILIDCAPNMGIFVINAIAACDMILIPMSTDFYAMFGVRLLLEFLEQVKEDLNPDLGILGILATRYDSRTKHAQEVLEQTRQTLGKQYKVFKTAIRETVRLKEQPITGQTILEYAPDHTSSEDYRNFGKEFVNEFKQKSRIS
jgi:chromosome partitioning protein